MSLYEHHAMTLVKDVLPKDDLKALINTFMIDAGVNMGNDFTDNSLERTIQIVESNFRFLPVCYVASAFKKGSLGNYGTGRLVPRVIYGWLNEITLEYNRDQDHRKLTSGNDYVHFKELNKYPLGRAIIWKIDHIPECDWDNVPIREVAEMIGRNEIPTLRDFGIEN